MRGFLEKLIKLSLTIAFSGLIVITAVVLIAFIKEQRDASSDAAHRSTEFTRRLDEIARKLEEFQGRGVVQENTAAIEATVHKMSVQLDEIAGRIAVLERMLKNSEVPSQIPSL